MRFYLSFVVKNAHYLVTRQDKTKENLVQKNFSSLIQIALNQIGKMGKFVYCILL